MECIPLRVTFCRCLTQCRCIFPCACGIRWTDTIPSCTIWWWSMTSVKHCLVHHLIGTGLICSPLKCSLAQTYIMEYFASVPLCTTFVCSSQFSTTGTHLVRSVTLSRYGGAQNIIFTNPYVGSHPPVSITCGGMCSSVHLF